MNGYIGFYNNKRAEVMANTTYEAQQKLQTVFQQGSRRKVKGYDISVVLAEQDGVQVVHTAID